MRFLALLGMTIACSKGSVEAAAAQRNSAKQESLAAAASLPPLQCVIPSEHSERRNSNKYPQNH